MEDTLIEGDAFNSLELIGRDVVDLIVTSPPYFNYRDYGDEMGWVTPDDWEDWCISLLAHLYPVIKPSGVIWWNTATGYSDSVQMTNVFDMVHRMPEYGLYLIDTIPWIKTSGPPKRFKNRPYPMVEYNFVFAKNPDQVTFYRDNVRRPYADSTISRMKYAVSNLQGDKHGEFLQRKKVEPNEGGATPPNYLLLPQDTTARPHPAPMLPALANWAIRAYTMEGGLVFDPLCGIGTSCVEARKLHRKYIGIDLNPEYLRIARESLQKLDSDEDPYKNLKDEKEIKDD